MSGSRWVATCPFCEKEIGPTRTRRLTWSAVAHTLSYHTILGRIYRWLHTGSEP